MSAPPTPQPPLPSRPLYRPEEDNGLGLVMAERALATASTPALLPLLPPLTAVPMPPPQPPAPPRPPLPTSLSLPPPPGGEGGGTSPCREPNTDSRPLRGRDRTLP